MAEKIVSHWHKSVECGEPTAIELAIDTAREENPDKPLQVLLRELLEAWSASSPRIPIKTNPSFYQARMWRIKPDAHIGDIFFSIVCQIAATDPICHKGLINSFIQQIE